MTATRWQIRNIQGYGSLFLKQLSAAIEDASCIVGKVEDPDKAEDQSEKLIRQPRPISYPYPHQDDFALVRVFLLYQG